MNQNKFQSNFQCEICQISYPNEMRVEKSTDFTQCYDCLFSMNFNDKNILGGSMGLDLKQYLDVATKYHDSHNEIPCNRMSDVGGCYICMTLLNIPFEIEEQKQEEKPEITSKKTIESNVVSDEYISHSLVIENDMNYDVTNLLIKI